MTITIVPLAPDADGALLAHVEIGWDDGLFAGVRLSGFAIWRRRAWCDPRLPQAVDPQGIWAVTEPAASTRDFQAKPFLVGSEEAHARVRDAILIAYQAHLARHGAETTTHAVTP